MSAEEEKAKYVASLFSELSREEVQLLYNNYRLDFLLFDYTIDLYLSLAKQ
jgi:hypothetical protein